jgi:hypothetical protein
MFAQVAVVLVTAVNNALDPLVTEEREPRAAEVEEWERRGLLSLAIRRLQTL